MSVDWPLDENVIRRRLTNPTFGMVRKDALGNSKPHQGWDFFAPIGTPVYAIADGLIKFTRTDGPYGVQLGHSFEFEGKTYCAFYAHLQQILVGAGQVKKGQMIALSGDSGNAKNMSTPDQHLHFEVRTVSSRHAGVGLQNRVSPIKIFKTCPLHQSMLRAGI